MAVMVGLASGALPVAVAEATALAAAAIPSPATRAWVLVFFTAGHVGGKVLWYAIGRLEQQVVRPGLRRHLDRAKRVAAEHPVMGAGVTAASATVSLPPFHLLTLAAGIVKAPLGLFVVVAFLGRLVRFSAIAAFPAALDWLIPR